MNEVRLARRNADASQEEFASAIGVSLQTFRVWDSGRRPVPPVVLARIRALVNSSSISVEVPPPGTDGVPFSSGIGPPDRAITQEAAVPATLMSLRELARELQISVYTLRSAARSGRLAVVYGTRVVFGRPVPQVTRDSGDEYRRQFYGRRARWILPPAAPLAAPLIPDEYPARLLKLRRQLRLTQDQLAAHIGAAGKAVIYQWESRKRRPSVVLWQRVLAMERARNLGAARNRR